MATEDLDCALGFKLLDDYLVADKMHDDLRFRALMDLHGKAVKLAAIHQEWLESLQRRSLLQWVVIAGLSIVALLK